ncbi:ABC transporter substrate-binding protein [Actinomadura vinacea]|uniref:ABC transporter substrate-binding protein n=1 Tax=Actinomadura vinacea TaxID=115336 RepID=A0ABN3IG31_9ACTN
MRERAWRRAVACAAVAACFPAGGCGTGGSDGYRVGFTTDLSGKYALNGVGQRDGFKAYFDLLNAEGGINGRKVEVTYLDDGGEVGRGSANVARLAASPDTSAIGGLLVSNGCGAAAPRATRLRVPLVCSAVADDLLRPVSPYVFAARTSQGNQAAPMIRFAGTLVRAAKPRIAIIYFASAASANLEKNLRASAQKRGWQVVADESVPLTATDVSAQTARIVAAKPDIVVGALYDPLAILFLRNMAARQVRVPFVNYDGTTAAGSLLPLKNPDYYGLSNAAMSGDGTGAGVRRFARAMQRNGKPATTAYANIGYLQAAEIAEGLRVCGHPCPGAKMRHALENLRFDSGGFASGPVGFSPDDHEGVRAVSFYAWDPRAKALREVASNVPAGGGPGA